MSRYDYQLSQQLSVDDPPFAALIMAAVRKADSANLELLIEAFPELVEEMQERYHAPGGILESDPDFVPFEERAPRHEGGIAGRSPE